VLAQFPITTDRALAFAEMASIDAKVGAPHPLDLPLRPEPSRFQPKSRQEET
jgi:hypothetical protein